MIYKLSTKSNITIIYGILTTYDYEKALERSDPQKKDKGGEVMQAAIDTVKTYRNIQKRSWFFVEKYFFLYFFFLIYFQ